MERPAISTTSSKEQERLFIAVPLPEPLKEQIGDGMKVLRQQLPFQRWVYPADLHMTVQFLGDVQREQITDIQKALQQSVLSIEALNIEINGLGVFGRPEQPAVLWAGIETDERLLGSVQQSVVEATRPLGFEPETRPYRPHLTLARRYEGTDAANELNTAAAVMSGNEWRWKADQIVLYRSKPGSQPMYEAIGRYDFGSSGS